MGLYGRLSADSPVQGSFSGAGTREPNRPGSPRGLVMPACLHHHDHTHRARRVMDDQDHEGWFPSVKPLHYLACEPVLLLWTPFKLGFEKCVSTPEVRAA